MNHALPASMQQAINRLKGAPVLASKTQTERPEEKKDN